MRKIALALVVLMAAAAQAQTNLQVHYDLGKGRKYVTTTLEMFKPDKWGNTFFFVDYNYSYGDTKSPSETYFEIARCFSLKNSPLSLQAEYNGGLGGNTGFSYPIYNAYLLGLDYGMHNADFSKTLNLKVLYKYIQGSVQKNSMQLTGVWGIHFLNKKMTFSGFADLWLEKTSWGVNDETSTVFITEPQIWYNFSEHLSAGSEVEIASNFAGVKGFKVCPTLAVKWNF